MKVKELVELLLEQDQEKEVVIVLDGCGCYNPEVVNKDNYIEVGEG